MVTNRFRVPKKQWLHWNAKKKKMFNELFAYMKGNVQVFKHPKAPKDKPNQWETTAWNAAWTAADLVE